MSLIDYAKTERQREAIKAWEDCGQITAKAAGDEVRVTALTAGNFKVRVV